MAECTLCLTFNDIVCSKVSFRHLSESLILVAFTSFFLLEFSITAESQRISLCSFWDFSKVKIVHFNYMWLSSERLNLFRYAAKWLTVVSVVAKWFKFSFTSRIFLNNISWREMVCFLFYHALIAYHSYRCFAVWYKILKINCINFLLRCQMWVPRLSDSVFREEDFISAGFDPGIGDGQPDAQTFVDSGWRCWKRSTHNIGSESTEVRIASLRSQGPWIWR